MKVYIVYGVTGAYTTLEDWPVKDKVFSDESKAREYAEKAEKRAIEIGAEIDSLIVTWGENAWLKVADLLETKPNEFDPDMQWSSPGTTYSYWSANMEE